MLHHRPQRLAALSVVSVMAVLAAGCAGTAVSRQSASVLEYLYPAGIEREAFAPADSLTLTLPARVGVAFVPGQRALSAAPKSVGLEGEAARFGAGGFHVDESLRRRLLEDVAAAFVGRPEIAAIEILPTHTLRPNGSFAEVERIGLLYDLDLIALVSYDQTQFGRETEDAWTYLTLVGALAVPADETETHTLLDASVFDIRSRNLLVSAAGMSASTNRSTPFETSKASRLSATSGFDGATADLITSLDAALDELAENVKSGTLRGIGSPDVAVEVRPGSHGVGGLLGWHLAAILALGVLGWRRA